MPTRGAARCAAARDRANPAARRAAWPVLAGALGLVCAALHVDPAGPSAVADAPGAPRAPVAPQDNTSHVMDGDATVVRELEEARQAVESKRYDAAVERLQRIVDRRFDDPAVGRAAPFVVGVSGRTVYEGAWLVARQRLAGSGPGLRQAYAAAQGARARALAEQAVRSLDETLLAEVARRFLPLDEGRRSALLLADLAYERGDADGALYWLEALEDLEELGDESAEDLAPWRRARLEREARIRARSPERRAAVLEALERAAQAGPAASALPDRIPWADQRRAPAVSNWTTTGGGADRAGLAASLGLALTGTSLAPQNPDDPLWPEDPPQADERGRVSPWLPPRAVVGREAIFACDGETLSVFSRRGLRRLDALQVRRAGEGRALDVGRAQDEFPLAEGQALTLEELPGGLTRLYLGSLRRLAWDDGSSDPAFRRPDAALAAFLWDGRTLMRLWRAGGSTAREPLPEGLSLFGAPCLYRGLLWIGGARPTAATSDQMECWLVALNPATGRVLRQVLLGTGSPVRARRLDEAVPSSPAAAHGRVVVVSALGFIAAVDADDGRVAWIYRYHRGVERGRARRMGSDNEGLRPRTSGFICEPPVLAFDLVVAAPTDSDRLVGLLPRPRGRARDLERWESWDRRDHMPRVAVEYVAGAVGGYDDVPPTFIVVGQGDRLEGEAPGNVVVGLEPLLGLTRWAVAPSSARAPVPYGRVALTEREVFVPLVGGLLAIDLARPGSAQAFLAVPGTQDDEELSPLAWCGNLLPVPGEGLLAINLSHVALWTRR